ncbi:MAG: Gldg family protein [Planctomycetota bacterium]
MANGPRKSQALRSVVTAVLMLLVAVEGVRLGSRLLSGRHDYSEDQLFTISDGTRAILGQLDDTLQVKAFFTQEIRSGEAALIKARVEALLHDFERLAGGNIDLVVQDPSVLSAAAEEALSHGIDPLPVVTGRGGEQNRQLIYLGAVLRYKSRREVLPLLNPWSLEVDFAGAVQRLLRDKRQKLGWTGAPFGPVDPPENGMAFGQFQVLKHHLEPQFDLQEIPAGALEAGQSIPTDLDLLLVLRPDDWHPRAVFALDQYLQQGGRAMICLDRVHNSPVSRAEHLERGQELGNTGLEALLRGWGTDLSPGHVWDREWAGPRALIVEDMDANGRRTGRQRLEPLRDPASPEIGPDGFERTFAPTGRTASAQFFWAHAFATRPAPEGIDRLDFVHSSDAAFLSEPILDGGRSGEEIEAYTRSLIAGGGAQRYALATRLLGTFHTVFERGAPQPFDVTRGDRKAKVGTTSEPVRSGEAPARVVLVGDSDWLRDPLPEGLAPVLPGATPANLLLFDNLVDWLTQSGDLIGVRSKQPRPRPLRNFQEEALREAGLLGLDAPRSAEEARERLRRADEAEQRAARARWLSMVWPLAVTLAVVFLLAGLWNWKERQA